MTGSNAVLEAVSTWFADHGRAGLRLPGGWFGRPDDNAHELTWSAARSRRVLLELDGQLLLILTDPGQPSRDGDDLVIPFARLIFDRQGYGTGTLHTDQYDSASLTLVALPPALRLPRG